MPLIFSLIQERGDIADDEMVRTFNLGIGLTVAVHPELADVALATLPDAVPGGHGGAGRARRAARQLRVAPSATHPCAWPSWSRVEAQTWKPC